MNPVIHAARTVVTQRSVFPSHVSLRMRLRLSRGARPSATRRSLTVTRAGPEIEKLSKTAEEWKSEVGYLLRCWGKRDRCKIVSYMIL